MAIRFTSDVPSPFGEHRFRVGHVLHVEDDAGLRLTRRRTLEGAGFHVVEADSVAAARDALLRERPDVVLTDIKLPDGNGFELTRWIRDQPDLAGIRVVQISAVFTEPSDRVQGLRSGADAYVIEPADPVELVVILQAMMRGRRAEAALQESEARFRLMADTSPLMVWVTDPEGALVFANHAYREFFGVTEDQVRRLDWQSAVHPDDAKGYLTAFLAALFEGSRFFAEARVRRADGQWRYIASYAAPCRSEDGTLLGFVGSSPDITELKEAAAQVREAMRLKDEFLASVAHELRQPIGAAQAAAAVIEARSDRPTREHAREVLQRQLQQMSRIVEDLLDASRVVRGEVSLRRSMVDLKDVLANALDTAAPVLEARGHELVAEVPDVPLGLEGDASRLQQVFVNVLTNAAKFTAPRGRIRVAVESSDAQVVVRVRDNGVGIPREALARIFDVFTRVEGDSDLGGFGIGLAVARKLVELHGGAIDASSEGPGKGTEFVLRFPLASRPPERASRVTSRY